MTKFDRKVRKWILEQARDSGQVFTSDVVRHFDLSIDSGAKRLKSLRATGHLVAGDVGDRGCFGNEITELGLALLRDDGAPTVRRWNFKPICQALGEGMRL